MSSTSSSSSSTSSAESTSGEQSTPYTNICLICKERSDAFHISLSCCDHCHQFFRGVLTSKHPLEQCRNPRCNAKCRTCHYQKCIDFGIGEAIKQPSVKRQLERMLAQSMESMNI